MRARLAASARALLAAVALLHGGAAAGEQSTVVDDVRVTVSTHWPSTLNRGWIPAVVHVANPTGDDRSVDLDFYCTPGPGTDHVTRSLRVPAGGGERFEIVLPARPALPNGYHLSVEAGDRGFISGIGAEQACPAHERIVLVASRAGPSTVAVAGWATEL